MTPYPRELARKFKSTVRKEFRGCCRRPHINWPGAYKHFLREYGLTEEDISYKEFESIE